MQAFDQYFRKKMTSAEFKGLYEKECHVCADTMTIFEKAADQGISTGQLADAMNVPAESIQRLMDADHCDPHLVPRLCLFFDLPLPKACPRLNQPSIG